MANNNKKYKTKTPNNTINNRILNNHNFNNINNKIRTKAICKSKMKS